MSSDTITIPRTLAVQLLDHARSRPEEEVCGLVAQASDGALRALRIPNAAEDPTHSFEMEPGALARAQRSMREARQRLWAVYHSHPHAGAEPSPRDLKLGEPDALQLIVSLDIRGVLQLRGWRFEDDSVREVILKTQF